MRKILKEWVCGRGKKKSNFSALECKHGVSCCFGLETREVNVRGKGKECKE